MKRFLRWLFRAYYNPYAKCRACRRVHLKSDMYQDAITGRFCTKEEAEAHWTEMQW